MKGKFLVLLITIIMSLCLIFVLVGCVDKTNEDRYNGETIEQEQNSGNNNSDNSSKDNNSGGHEHSYTDSVKAPTCTTKGYTLHTCVCGDVYEDNFVDALGHKYSDPKYIWNENRCSAMRVCLRDSEHVENETVIGVYIKDTDATCSTAEKGHLMAVFSNSAFANQETTKNIEIQGEPLNHDYGEVSYTWSGNQCVATRICSRDDSHLETETVVGIYVKDIEASCDEPEKGHYVAEFNNNVFGICATTTESVVVGEKKGHSFSAISYLWSGMKCTAIKTCLNDDAHTVTETVTAVYVKDTDASCDTSETGHYEATFDNPEFELQKTATSSIVGNEGPKHTWKFGNCSACGETQLQMVLSSSGDYYAVAGRGNFWGSKLVIPSAYKDLPVKLIYSNAFSGFSALVDITLSCNITNIQEYAFYNCNKLENIAIPNMVTHIGVYAFSGCNSLRSITIEKNMKNIASNAFFECNSLAKVNYIGTIDDWASIEFASATANPIYYSKNLFIDGVNVLTGAITVNASRIGAYAFYYCNSLTSLTIGNNVVSIGNYAFHLCESLTHITIGEGVVSIGIYAFYCCGELTEINFNAKNCSDLKNNNYVFYNAGLNTNGITVTFGSQVEFIPAYLFNPCNTSYHIPKLASVTIGESTTYIGGFAFAYCNTQIYNKKDNVYYLGSSSNDYFAASCMVDNNTTNLVLDDSCEIICSYAFADCNTLTDVTIPNNATKFGVAAFYLCNSLTKVNYLGTIDQWASIEFSNAYANPIYYAKTLYIGDENVLEGDIILNACKIGSGAFINCDSLRSVTLGDKVTSIGYNAFYGCYSLEKVNYLGTIDQWASIEFGDVYANPISGSRNLYIHDELQTDIVINSEKINACAFSHCESLTSVTIGNRVTSIGSYAFYNCSVLTCIQIPNSVISIDKYAFEDCNSLTKLNYLGTINQWASIEFGNSYANPISVSRNLYIYDELQTDITINVETINKYAFEYCNSLTSITIGESVTSIGDFSFSGCELMTSVTMGENVTSIGEMSFINCHNLIEIYNKSNLTITIGSDYNGYIGSYAKNVYTPINGASKLNTDTDGFIVYSEGNDKILVGYKGSSTEHVNIPSGITEIYKRVFFNNDNITKVIIPDSVTTIGKSTFFNCTSLTSVTIGNRVTSIGSQAFYYCDALDTIYYKGTADDWKKISISSYNSALNNATRYYYVEKYEEVPKDGGNYWHYVDGKPTPWQI